MSLVGRDRELAWVRDHLDVGDHVLLVGEPGVGRSALWAAGIGWSAGRPLLTSALTSEPTSPPYRGLAALLADVGGAVVEAVPAATREALEAVRSGPGCPSFLDPRVVGTGLLHLFRELAGDGRLLIAVDDVHLLDDASADVLAFAVRRLAGHAQLLITVPSGTPARLLESLGSTEVRRLGLAGLDVGATRRLLAERLPVALPRRVGRLVFEATDGNPGWALAVGESLASSGWRPEVGEPLPVPGSLADELAALVDWLPEETLEALTELALRSDRSLDAVPQPLESAQLAGVILHDGERIVFRPPVLAAALLARTSAEQRRALHRRIAQASSDPVTRTRHLALGATGPDTEIAAAAESAGLFELAARLTPADRLEDAARRAVAAAEQQLRAGDRDYAAELATPYADRPEAAAVLAEVTAHDDVAVAARQYETALARADSPAVLAQIELGLAGCRLHQLRLNEAAEYAGLLTGQADYDDARDRLAAECSAARDRDEETAVARGLGWLSWVEVACGRFPDAVAAAREAVEVAVADGGAVDRHSAHAHLAWALAHGGDADEVRRLYDETAAPAEVCGSALALALLAAARVLVEQAVGDPAAAWAAGERFADLDVFPALPELVDALASLGRLDEAAELLGIVEARSVSADGAAARCRGNLSAAQGDTEVAVAVYHESLTLLEAVPAPFEHARTLLARGIVERGQRRRAAAAASLAEAGAAFDRLGAPLWSVRAHQEAGRIGGRRAAAPSELTPSERKVAVLAARGLSNKEIAAELFVSAHTVEAHLSKVFAKLGARSRSQLSGLLPPQD